MEKLQFILSICLMLCTSAILAQTGTVRGTLVDDVTGETIPFANVIIEETQDGFSTDLDGAFSHDLAAGTYTLSASYIGYADLNVTDVVVEEGKVIVLDLRLKEESELIDEVVIVAAATRNTEAALMTIQKKAPGMLDGISKQAISRSGDGDVGAAIKRVTGVSVEDGKHVIVRGLGDRYSKTILNGMDIPGLDPDKNSVQLDIFPTNLLDNILVYKSFTPNLPGDFTGGMVNIETKDFPERRTFNISVGGSYNPDMHLIDNFISYQGGNTDFLGKDDGTRELPIHPNTTIPERTSNNAHLTTLTNKFSPIMSTLRKSIGLNKSLGLTYGDQINSSFMDIGYTFSASYKTDSEFYDDMRFGVFFKEQDDNSINELSQDRSDKVNIGKENVMWSTFGAISGKTKNHKISLSALRLQNGESTAAVVNSIRTEFGQAVVVKNNLEYKEREVTNILLKAKHSISPNFKVNWSLSPTISKMTEPDIRITAYEINEDSGEPELNPSTAGLPTRTWRNLDEDNYAGKVDMEFGFDTNKGLKSKLKFGVSNVYKDRDFRIYDFVFPLHKRGLFDLTGNPDELFTEDNIWTNESDQGVYLKGARELSKTYQAQQNVAAAYVMNEYPVSKKLKAIYGLRVEKAENWYTGRKQFVNNPETDLFENRKVLDELDFLPSLSVVYNMKDDSDNGKTMNLRASINRTLARPSFKEKSIAQIDDRISGRQFIGNIDLEETKIINGDVRWEYFLPRGQIFSVSTFYKAFTNPIEMTAFDATTPNSFTPRNVGNAQLFGLELEGRKNLGFLSSSLDAINVMFNTTIVKSAVEMTQNEFEGRQLTARAGETISDTREMVGQSPFVINAGVNFLRPESGWEVSLLYNVQGERLSIVGIGKVPDVYEKPFNSLNFKLTKKLGADQRTNISVSASNLLGAERSSVYKSFEAADQLFELYSPRRTFSFSLSHRIF